MTTKTVKRGTFSFRIEYPLVFPVSKEIVMHLVAYNLIRLLMWQAAAQHGKDLHRLSFAGMLHRWRTTMPILIQHRSPAETL